MVRGSGGEDHGDVGGEKLHSPVADVNFHRPVLPLGYVWASPAAQHSAELFILPPRRTFD